MARVTEAWQSRPITAQTAEIWYIVDQTNDEQDARDAMLAEAPQLFDSKQRDDYQIDKIGLNLFKGIVRYKAKANGGLSGGGESTRGIEFSTSGGTRRIFTSKQTVCTAASGTPPTRDNAILVDANAQIVGCEIVVPKFEFKIRKKMSADQLTDAYIDVLYQATGKINSDTWKGFAPYQALFKGADGSQSGAEAEVVFTFSAGENKTGQTIAGITGISYNAHDFVWVYYSNVAPNGATSMTPDAKDVSVETVYESTPFSALQV